MDVLNQLDFDESIHREAMAAKILRQHLLGISQPGAVEEDGAHTTMALGGTITDDHLNCHPSFTKRITGFLRNIGGDISRTLTGRREGQLPPRTCMHNAHVPLVVWT